ncbi:MAG: nucleotide exchange factor GrpE [Nitrospinota bacterium]
MVEVNSEDKDNIVTDELEKGYRIRDRLLRPAKVRVGKYVAESHREV